MSSAHNPFTTIYSQPIPGPRRQRIGSIDTVLRDTIKCGLGGKALHEFWDDHYPDTLISQGGGTLDSYGTFTNRNKTSLYSFHYLRCIFPRHGRYILSYLRRQRCHLMRSRPSCVTTSIPFWIWMLMTRLKLRAQQLTRRNPNHLTVARATRT